jgi:hypothetical protein
LDRLSIRTLKYLDLLIPPLGKIIKIKPDYLLVNLGKPDNVKTGSSINFYRISRSTFFYDQEKNKVYLITKGKVTEVDGLISKVMLEKNQDYAKLRLDDLASSKDEEIEKKAGKVKN